MALMSPYDSLILASEVELWGGPAGVPSTNPLCPGVVFKVMPGFTLSTPQPTTDYTGTLVTDGERPFGTRASNRLITLPIRITTPATGDWTALAGARELLLSLVDQPFFTLLWTRRQSPEDITAFPMVLDCFRAQPSVVQYGGFDGHELQTVQMVTLTIPALPYGRADTAQQVSFTSPVAALNAPPPPPTPVVLDAFTTINSPQATQSPVHVVGPNSCYWDPARAPASAPDGSGTPFTYAATLNPQPNLTGLTGLTMWLGLGSRYRYNLDHNGTSLVTVVVSLTDADGTVISTSARRRVPSSADPASPAWTLFQMGIPQNNAAFNYTQVASYSLTIRNRAPCSPAPGGELRWTCAYIDALTAVPPSTIPLAPTIRGSLYHFNGVAGTAHAPVAFAFQQSPAPGTVTTVTAVGAGNYTVPANTAYCKAEATGAGGAGGGQTGSGVGGGGGGGEYAAEPLFPATGGQVIPYSVGTAGTAGAAPANGAQTVFGSGSGTTLVANGGISAAQNSITGAAGGSGSVNTVHYRGGQGRTASGSVGGGGGSSGGSASAGQTPVGTAAVTLTGSGNWLCPTGVTQVTASGIGGGGGGGSGNSSTNGSGGGGGESATQVFTVVPGTNYAYAVGGAGSGAGSGGGLNGAAGGNTTFTVGGTVMTAHGGAGGPAYGWAGGNGGNGGSGSAAPTRYTGGQGGSSEPYTGGGGSSAGTNGVGNAGNGYGGPGSAPYGGGGGGNGSGSSNGAGGGGQVPGGGGGGSYNTGYAGGNGAAGTLILNYPGGAPTNNGGAAVTGGGAGGAGGGSANTAGTAGSAPGGGGGGANSTGTAEPGGAGGAGQLKITPYLPPAFKTLIAHRPSATCPLELNPLVNIGGVAPGATEFAVVSLDGSCPARFDGTYSIVLIAQTWNNPTAPRTISVTVKQYEAAGGNSVTVTTTPVTLTPSTQISNGIVVAGVLTLPYKSIPSDNYSAYFTVIITDSNASDTYYDLMFLDTQGQTVMINEPSLSYFTYWIDIPNPVTGLGLVLGSQSTRSQAVSVSDAAVLSGGPLMVYPGNNLFLAYCVEGAPSLSASYFPAYYADRPG